MSKMDIVLGLMEDLRAQVQYRGEYEVAYLKAEQLTEEHRQAGNKNANIWQFLPKEYWKKPSNARIKRTAMVLREMLLDLYN